MFAKILKKIFGTRNERYLKSIQPIVDKINSLEKEYEKLSDNQLRLKTDEFKQRLKNGETLDDILPEAFAVVREASKRTLGLRHFDVQLMGGIVLHQGKIAEMKTGEGKTLVATLPAYLNALTGNGVHVVTVNEYLAERDSFGKGNFRGMGEIYTFLGLTVGCIKHGMSIEEKQKAYACDITYGTNNEFGFDYLRDNMVTSIDEKVQRGHNYAIVDEVDSILIDEARTPLIISGPSEESTDKYYKIDRIIPYLKNEIDYKIDEKTRTCVLTEEGVEKVEKLLNVNNLYDPVNIELVHHVNQALRAHTLFKKDVDYIVKDNQVIIVDEFTGRLMPGRRYSDGLHQALEAKERVKIQEENQTLATITFQNYFRMYKKLAGMTGTAATEANEFMAIYNLEVIVIPTHKPMIRIDHEDSVYLTREEKLNAIVEKIVELNKKGQPVLVGTISIERNEELSHLLKKRGIKHQVLNAKYHELEAEIIAKAGQKGAVTVATNMAGRGVDIVLGEGVKELGGLFILGTERHEARRIDNQLRGRSGRQGDPGESKFYLSLEDDLMRLFGGERMKAIMSRLNMEKGQEITHPWITKSIERAQKTVEAHNFEIRKYLLEYDNVMNKQREVIYSQRNNILEGKDIKSQIFQMMEDVIEDKLAIFIPEKAHVADWDINSLSDWLKRTFNLIFSDEVIKEKGINREKLKEKLLNDMKRAYEIRESSIGSDIMRWLERTIMLQVIDSKWKDHLYAMDQLREGIGLRAYGQKDPLIEYKREAYEMFMNMVYRIKEEVLSFLFKVQPIKKEEAIPIRTAIMPSKIQFQHEEIGQFERKATSKKISIQAQEKPSQFRENIPSEESSTIRRQGPKIGRNDPCPCGSGKKYKKCCGK
jgi:preprotein translocase subunit SecA